MSIEAKIIADSISPEGKRLTTMQLRYPKFIHGELMTHRVFSRNAASSRAIPVKRMIEDLRRDPAMPVFWGTNKPGMQAGAEVDDIESCKKIWLAARDQAIVVVESLIEGFQLHKQIANRVLEPWFCINTLVTATEWDNFYELRVHPDAQPEMRELAQAMLVAQSASTPKELVPGEWHLPYADNDEDIDRYDGRVDTLRRISVARCARVSYLTHDGKPPNPEDDLALYERLVGSRPIHASPAEHQATPDSGHEMPKFDDEPVAPFKWDYPELHGNLVGWQQYRKILEKEHAI